MGGLMALFMNASNALAQWDTNSQAFLDWARQSRRKVSVQQSGADRSDLAVLGKAIGSASVVAASEATHLGREALLFRNRLFEYLVEHMGFTAIAIESGFTEGKLAYDYVLAGTGDLQTVMTRGFSWGFGRSEENASLIRWMRSYNADPRHQRKIRFYGFDMPGSPASPGVVRGIGTALGSALEYLDRVDSVAANVFRTRTAAFLQDNPRFSIDRYGTLDNVQRDRLTAAMADLVTTFEVRAVPYVAASSEAQYARGYRDALNARQVDAWFRHIPLGYTPATGYAGWIWQAHEVRDRMMADNLSWILDQEGPGAKVLVFASRFHIAGAPVHAGQAQPNFGNITVGQHLRLRLRNRLVAIGNVSRPGECPVTRDSVRTPASDFDGLVKRVGEPSFWLDLRTAPAPVSAWLHQGQTLGISGPFSLTMDVAKAFDIVHYHESPGPSCER